MTGGRLAALPQREADIRQAEVFHTVLAQRRAALCDRLDLQAAQLAQYEGSHDTAGVRRKRLRIKETGAEIRDIDRMLQSLTFRLLGEEHTRRSV
jgi:hypothetical protein